VLPYFIGCPSWSEAGWRGQLYPENARAADFLGHYCQVFNAVEGNTTFYARPAPATVQRWVERMPTGFHFCAKLPRDISHEGDLRSQFSATDSFLSLLAPLGERVSPLWLQLPAAFGPARLGELAAWLDEFQQRRIAVEVRNPAFFAKGEEERALNRLLNERGVERICLDARAMLKPRNHACRCARRPLVTSLRCVLSAVRIWLPTSASWRLGWTRWLAGSRRDWHRMFSCIRRITCWRRPWPDSFTPP
jgi:uncharacterized protein YecE (DUF72 family)